MGWEDASRRVLSLNPGTLQSQANRWVKAMERDAGLEVVKPSNKDLLRTLENGIRFGRAVLLENIGEAQFQRLLRP
jgi:hypothetical protein